MTLGRGSYRFFPLKMEILLDWTAVLSKVENLVVLSSGISNKMVNYCFKGMVDETSRKSSLDNLRWLVRLI